MSSVDNPNFHVLSLLQKAYVLTTFYKEIYKKAGKTFQKRVLILAKVWYVEESLTSYRNEPYLVPSLQ